MWLLRAVDRKGVEFLVSLVVRTDNVELGPETWTKLRFDQAPNIYLELMPLRLHCQLTLAALRLDLGLIDEACQLLQDAELCMTRCVHLVPWQHVQFCLLKLRWRKLKYRVGLAPSAPLDAPNAVLYRDPKTFATGICPAVDSPLYRTFLQRAKPPQIAAVSEWVPPYERQPEEALQIYMQEFLQVARVVLKEGGNDLRQLLQLLDEALEENLRTETMLLSDPELSAVEQKRKPRKARLGDKAAGKSKETEEETKGE
eukprot:s401_g28.t1